MTKIDIISGFLGAGKTTLIKKLLSEALKGEQVVLIENEFGEIGIDGGFLKDSGIEIREMNSGCICCSLVGDFGTSLKEVITTYHPDRILREPVTVCKNDYSESYRYTEGYRRESSQSSRSDPRSEQGCSDHHHSNRKTGRCTDSGSYGAGQRRRRRFLPGMRWTPRS